MECIDLNGVHHASVPVVQHLHHQLHLPSNPITRRLSPLRLHPLIIMDCTLEEEKYMGLDFDRALTYCRNLVEQVNNVGGELVLLWHNDSVQEGSGSYLRKLYAQLLKELAKQ